MRNAFAHILQRVGQGVLNIARLLPNTPSHAAPEAQPPTEVQRSRYHKSKATLRPNAGSNAPSSTASRAFLILVPEGTCSSRSRIRALGPYSALCRRSAHLSSTHLPYTQHRRLFVLGHGATSPQAAVGLDHRVIRCVLTSISFSLVGYTSPAFLHTHALISKQEDSA